MRIACWSVKGGSGTTVVAAALAVLLARRAEVHPSDLLLVDLGGDLAAALGIADPPALVLPGGGLEPPDLRRRGTAVSVLGGARLVRVLAPADGAAAAGRNLERALADEALVLVDCGRIDHDGPTAALGRTLAASADDSLLVARPCYLALRRAARAEVVAHGVVLVGEPGRALGRRDVEAVVAAPVRAEVPWDPAIARAVDAGLLAVHLPRKLVQGLRGAA